MIEIRDPLPSDEQAWRRLWDGYVRFYDATVPEEVTASTWARILDPSASTFASLAEHHGEVLGFSIAVLHHGTWSISSVCHLEDLFVDPAARGRGAGRLLIQNLVERSRRERWGYLYWHTRAGNTAARKLYDSFVSADDFVRYRMFFGDIAARTE